MGRVTEVVFACALAVGGGEGKRPGRAPQYARRKDAPARAAEVALRSGNPLLIEAQIDPAADPTTPAE